MSDTSGGSLTQLSDTDLLGLAQEGQRAAFETLFHRHQDRIYSIALGILGNSGDARDIVQETFFRAFRRLRTLDRERGLLAYLCKTASNAAIDALRNRRMGKVVSLEVQVAAGFDAPDVRLGPEGVALRGVQSETVLNEVIKLPDDQRVVVVLHHLEGLPLQDIAARLRIPVGTVKSRLGRGRDSLRRKLVGKI